jgi:hypothetical protein
MALPLPVIPQQPDAYHLAPHRIKRCTFRRLIDVEAGTDRVYDVECLFPDRKVPIPLGDLESATPSATRARRRTSSDPTRTSVSEAVCKPSSVPSSAEAHVGDGHPSVAAGRPTAHAAYPRAGQRTSPPDRSPDPGYALLFGLAPGGVCRVSLRHPTRGPGGGIVTVALVLVSRRTGITRHPALRSSDFPHGTPGSLRRSRATIRPPR